MRTGGIVIGIIGAVLFVWHVLRVTSQPDYEGYASHQVMSVNAAVLLIFGAVIYFMGTRRMKRMRRGGPTQTQNKVGKR